MIGIRIKPLGEVPDRAQRKREIEAIFFSASLTQSFPNAAARAAFLDRWLGRYLNHFPAEVFVAVAADDAVIGYLVGALVDPACTAAFDDIGYFRDFADLTRMYPGHLHINLDERWRSRGIGGGLIEVFAAHAAANGVAGVHVVTGEGMRNVGFYERRGFERRGVAMIDGRPLLFLGRALARPDTFGILAGSDR